MSGVYGNYSALNGKTKHDKSEV